MKALILAAGQGTRLRPLTDERPKCLVEVEGVSLLERQLAVLRSAAVEDIVIVGGYRADMLEGRGCRVVRNPDFARTNMVHTLFCARDELSDDDVIVAYGDIVYEPKVLHALARASAPLAVTVDRHWHRYWSLRMPDPLADAETLRIGPDGRLAELGKKPASLKDVEAQYMGLFKIRHDRLASFVSVYDGLDRNGRYDGKDFANMYMTSFLQHLIDIEWDVRAVPVDGGWLELDTLDDRDLYARLAQEGRLDELCRLDAPPSD